MSLTEMGTRGEMWRFHLSGKSDMVSSALGWMDSKVSLVHHSLTKGSKMRVSKGWESFGSRPKGWVESKEAEFGDVSRSSDCGERIRIFQA
jgi:hypothetical protein